MIPPGGGGWSGPLGSGGYVPGPLGSQYPMTPNDAVDLQHQSGRAAAFLKAYGIPFRLSMGFVGVGAVLGAPKCGTVGVTRSGTSLIPSKKNKTIFILRALPVVRSMLWRQKGSRSSHKEAKSMNFYQKLDNFEITSAPKQL